MKEISIEKILSAHASGVISITEATESIKNLSYEDIGFARVDHSRAERQGFPEVIFGQAGMIIVPCSMGTLGAIASGAGTNLIHRAADVTLKENRKLVLVPRETPYNAIHLENMLKLSRAGAEILPASPGFYHRPKTIDELVDHLVFRILDQFDIPHSRKTEWSGEEVK